MPTKFSQIYIQVVFAVKNRESLILPRWEEQLYKYITGTVQNKGQKMLAINGASDHLHMFIGMKPTCNLSDLVREVKKSSNEFVNSSGFIRHQFGWQGGFGAFSYSHSHIDKVVKYIQNQKEHHKKKSFREEYIEFLTAFEVEFDDMYLFKWI